MLTKEKISFEKRLKLSYYSHIIFPYHVLQDQLQEQAKGNKAIGTTGRGIGPCFSDRVARQGIRLSEMVSPEILKQRLEEILPQKNRELQALGGKSFVLEDI